MADNYMTFNDAVEVLTPYAEKINTIKPESITWAAYQSLTSEQRAAKRYLITDYPSPTGYVDKLSDLEDVSINSQTLSNGQIPVYNSTNEVWENKTIFENSLTSTATDKALSAKMGKKLNDEKIAYTDTVNNLTSTSTTAPLSANMGRVLGQSSNGNLLLNPFFEVNESGFTSSSTVGETVNEWFKLLGSDGTISLDANGCLQFPSDKPCYMTQYLDTSVLSGLMVTVSLMYSTGDIESASAVYNGGTQSYISDGKMKFDLVAGRISLYHDTTDANVRAIKAVKLELGERSTLANDLAPNKTIETLKCQGADFSGVSNENLLLNGWFTVNQRGATTVTTNNAYGADMWKKVGGTSATFSSSGVSLNGQISQFFENQLPNGAYTATLKYANGTFESGTVVKTNDTDTIRFIDRTGFTVAYIPTSKFLTVYTDSATSIRAAKLELGSKSTLAHDVAPNYTTELLKCQNYHYDIVCGSYVDILGTGLAMGATEVRLALVLPTTMRAVPTIAITGAFVLYGNGGSFAVTNFTVREIVGNVLVVSATASGLTTNELYVLTGSDARISLSADL